MPPPRMTDSELVRRIAGKDPIALKVLIDRYQAKILNLCAALLDNHQSAEDVAQEVFFKVYQAAGKFRGDCLFSTWIYRIAVNRCRNFNRDNKRFRWLSGLDRTYRNEHQSGQGLWTSGVADPEFTWIEDETRKLIQRVIASLPEKQKTLLVLHKYEGHSYKEIAEILEVSLSAVESGLHRAKMNLQKRLAPHMRKICGGRKF